LHYLNSKALQWKEKIDKIALENSSLTIANGSTEFISYNFTSLRGRPKLVFDFEQLKCLRRIGLTWTQISEVFGISRSTLYRRLKETNFEDNTQLSCLSDQELDDIIVHLKNTLPHVGERVVIGHLNSLGHYITRERVRQSIHRIDPVNTSLRWHLRISRRTYSVPGPNSLWHIDGNHKLIRWKIVIHGGIDGYSRLIVYLKCSSNNRASTVAKSFIDATTKYFIPSRIRCDFGKENIDVAKFMLTHRGFERGSFITGSSVHNQRIERLWRDVFQQVAIIFYKLFYHMEEVGLLNPLNDAHLYSLHYVFLPRIQRALNLFVKAWNCHPISGEKNHTPVQLFTLGINKLIHNGRISEDFYDTVDFDYGIDYEGGFSNDTSDSDGSIEVNPPMLLLSEETLQQISTIDPLAESTVMGVDIYITLVQILIDQ
jgi:hypothetical protein